MPIKVTDARRPATAAPREALRKTSTLQIARDMGLFQTDGADARAPVMPGLAASFAARSLTAHAADAAVHAKRAPSTMVAAFAARTTRAAPEVTTGTRHVEDRAAFDKLGVVDDVPGAAGVTAVKFFVKGVDTKKPELWLIDGNEHAYHYDFATRALGMQIDLRDFNAQTYFSDARKNVAGTVVAHDAYVDAATGEKGLFAVEFWPTDPVAARHVNRAFDALAKAMPWAKRKMAYHPAGDTQEALLTRDAGKLSRMKVPVIKTDQLFAGVTFSPLNQGTGYGVLRIVDPNDPQAAPPTARDVAIFKTLPNDVAHVGAIITETPQTPLSHINLKAKQNDTPNAYLKDATKDPAILALVGKVVKVDVGPQGVTIVEAPAAEAEAFLESKRPAQAQTPARDLSKKDIVDLDALHTRDQSAFGAKAANLGELRKVLGGEMVPDGYAVPFSFYDDFMKATGLYDEARAMMDDPLFKSDPKVREEKLEKFKKKVKKADVPPALSQKIAALQAKFPPGQGIRCRSSTNNEDLEGFNGAGLYDSYTHRPDEGHLEKTIKQVWSSLWNFRAFEEREFWRIDHFQAAMAVAVHPNMDDEQANGVAITRNIYDANWPGFYVNAQVGEALVTNPGPADVPDEMLVSAIGEHGEYETQFIRHSTLAEGSVLTKEQLAQLVSAMEKIQEHFKIVYGRQGDDTFAMDLEFKIDKDGQLRVKQARPVVD